MLKKLVPMTQFILDIDWMSTKEFCDKYNITNTVFISFIKQKMFVEYAKFLNSNLQEDMFTGEKPIFPDFTKCSPKQAEERGLNKSFDNFGENEFMIRIPQENYKCGNEVYKSIIVTRLHIKKVEDMVGLGITYNKILW